MQYQMSNNKLTIAAAGSGKTTYLIKEALNSRDGRVIITTYTIANEAEIKKENNRYCRMCS